MAIRAGLVVFAFTSACIHEEPIEAVTQGTWVTSASTRESGTTAAPVVPTDPGMSPDSSGAAGSSGTTAAPVVPTDPGLSPDSSGAAGSSGTTAGAASDGGAPAGSTGGPPGTGGDGAGTGEGGCVERPCGDVLHACGDCLDNDGDGAIDLGDPECLSPCDDREDVFAGGPGDGGGGCKQDCFWDGNSGHGDDGCQWDLKCDPAAPGAPKCEYDPGHHKCSQEQSPGCLAACRSPNGCDCFGCCALTVGGVKYSVYLGDADCSLANLDECAQCTQNDACGNSCAPEDCELCFGASELPPGCAEPSCPNGQPCESGADGVSDDCGAGLYCRVGCCVAIEPA